MLCDSVGLTPRPNNGTWRLPLNIVGLHDPDNQSQIPPDPVTTSSIPVPSTAAATETLNSLEFSPTPTLGVNPIGNPTDDTPPSAETEESDLEKIESEIKGFWDWIKEESSKLWNKVSGVISD